MKNYELTVLFHPGLEMNIEPAIEKVKKTLEANGGKIIKEENDGKKRLAYPISGETYAVYYYADVTLPAEAPNKISGIFNITEEILRHLLVRADERRAKVEAERAEKAEKSTTNESEEKGEE